jgi:hypothetical protein
MIAWRIDEGHWGDIRLDGLCAINTYAWPGAINEGDGRMQSIIDERASEPQRRALVAILQGEGADPGAIMFQPDLPNDVRHAPRATVQARPPRGGHGGAHREPACSRRPRHRLEPIRNKVTGALHRARIALPFGKEFTLAEVASGTTRATSRIVLEFTDTHAHVVVNRLTSQGVAQ